MSTARPPLTFAALVATCLATALSCSTESPSEPPTSCTGKCDDASVDAGAASLGTDDIFGESVSRDESYWVADGRIYYGGEEVVLRGINWFGLDTEANALHGLWSGRSVDSFLEQIAELGFTALRVPIAPQSIRPGAPSAAWANVGDIDTGREHLEYLVERAGAHGLRVLLDVHTCDAAAGHLASDPEACAGYTVDDWLSDLRSLAALAGSHPHVVGIDLFNEPYGLTWDAWRELAARAGEAVLRENPRVLVFVEGVGGASPAGGFNPFWGENLAEAGARPVEVPLSRLVYSPHVYGPSVADQDYFHAGDFPDNLPAIWEAHFGYLVDSQPIAIGEFGGRLEGLDRDWHYALVDYLNEREAPHFFYWCLNPNSGDTGGLLEDDWMTVSSERLDMLRRLGL